MALAFLFSRHMEMFKGHYVADNPLRDVIAATVDHGLRPESTTEAAKVAANVRGLGIRATVLKLNWGRVFGPGVDPCTQSNVESLARTLRYRKLGRYFALQNATSLFFGHHRDDQYETVLMRILSGHGYRGLQGMRRANSIPECYDIERAYKSGLLEDQMRKHPYLKFSPASKETRALRNRLRHESTLPGFEQLRTYLGVNDLSARFPGHLQCDSDPNLPYLAPLNIEDGGITIYRPLLDFDKDRLIATCEANNVPWFEDSTNSDPTLTTRNAIRKMSREHQLPAALQKPSILALAERSKRRTQEEEAQVSRMLARQASIVDFDPNVGSLLVDLPSLDIGRLMRGRRGQAARDRVRRVRQRLLAAIVARKMIDFVTPDAHLPRISNLENTVRRLYPNLYDGTPHLTPGGTDRKAFSIAGVQFEPVPSYNSTRWLLSRAPFSSNFLRAVMENPGQASPRPRWGTRVEPVPMVIAANPSWKSWTNAILWDGRFWIRLSAHDRRVTLHVLPVMASHTKDFKAALPPKERARFEKLLKFHAPGKIRYTLPGIYTETKRYNEDGTPQFPEEKRLLALPTLGVHIAGLEQSVHYEVRYKHVDVKLLGKQKSGSLSRMHRLTVRSSQSRKLRRERLGTNNLYNTI